jgi:hypothetical protein
MSTRNRIMLAGLALCCVISFSLLLILNNAVRGFILDPIVSGFNAFRYAIGYMPQDIEWLISLLFLFVVALVTLVTRLPKRAIPERIQFIPPFPSEGPTMRLAQILEKSTHNKFRRERVILEMRDLAAHALAYHKGISVEEAKEALNTPDWTSNVSVRDFLSLDKHRAGKHDQREFHNQVDHALAHIERMYQEV